MKIRRTTALGALLVTALAVAGCTDNSDSSSADGPIEVSSTNTECTLSETSAPSGTVKFAVTNDGDKVTEFYLLGTDGQRIVGEVENIGPGLTRNLIVQASPGEYKTACKPGMKGAGIRGDFTVTDSD